MRPYVSLSYLREHFRVVDPGLLLEREPTKYYDPFVEKD